MTTQNRPLKFQQYIRGYLQEPITRCQLIISQRVVETIICNSRLTEAGVINPVTGCVCSVTCVFALTDVKIEVLRFKQEKKKSLFVLTHSYKYSISSLAWQRALLATAHKTPPNMTGLLFPICQTYFLDQTKTNGNVSVGPYPIRNCFHILQVFFFSFIYVILLTFWMMYTVLFWLYKILCSHSMRWLEVRLWNIWWVDGKTRYGLGDTRVKTAATISWGEGENMKSQGEDGADGMLGRERVMGYLDEEAVQRDKVGCVGGYSNAPLCPLSVHFIQQGCGVSSDWHGCALDHRAGWRSWRHPLRFLSALCFLFLQPLLGHLAPVYCGGAAAAWPAVTEDRGRWLYWTAYERKPNRTLGGCLDLI